MVTACVWRSIINFRGLHVMLSHGKIHYFGSWMSCIQAEAGIEVYVRFLHYMGLGYFYSSRRKRPAGNLEH